MDMKREDELRKFDYKKIMNLSPPVALYHSMAQIHEFKGKQMFKHILM